MRKFFIALATVLALSSAGCVVETYPTYQWEARYCNYCHTYHYGCCHGDFCDECHTFHNRMRVHVLTIR